MTIAEAWRRLLVSNRDVEWYLGKYGREGWPTGTLECEAVPSDELPPWTQVIHNTRSH